jgi:hypothetical protein
VIYYGGNYWWVRAMMTSELRAEGLSLEAVAEQIDRDGLEFELDQAAGANDFAPLARVRFREVIAAGPSNEVAFEPTIDTAPGGKLAPEWLTDIRQRAYEGRAGRPTLAERQ